MKSVFQVEWNTASNDSSLTGVYNTPLTPPTDYPTPPSSYSSSTYIQPAYLPALSVDGWMEFWDYAGGASFRAFLVEEGDDKSLFAFFDVGLVGRDLKQA
jgi:hypothetical protein